MTKTKIHMLSLRDSIAIVGLLVTIVLITCFLLKVAGIAQVRSEALSRGRALAESYNVNHVLHESKWVYPK